MGPVEETRRRILEAARRLARAGGFEGVQMRDLADEAGVARATLYRYFTTREEVFAALTVEWGLAFLERLRAEPLREADPHARLRWVLRSVLEEASREPSLIHALLVMLVSEKAGAATRTAGIGRLLPTLLAFAAGGEATPLDGRTERLVEHVLLASLVAMQRGDVDLARACEDLDHALDRLVPPSPGPSAETVSRAPFARSSRSLLTWRDLPRFPGETLFDRVGRTVCAADCLPRKELFESWEFAKRVIRRLPEGNVFEAASGHGLVGMLLVLLSRGETRATLIDPTIPASHAKLYAAMTRAFPRLEGRVEVVREPLGSRLPRAGERCVAVHACGALSDAVMDAALAARASVALMPCCHDVETCDTGGLLGILPVGLAVDATRVARLQRAGYVVRTGSIPGDITPEHRILVGWPAYAALPGA